ncbi:MAG: phosphoglycerol geranylgeranyltransferase [Methanophagales archaeon ANME-1-THS]|nr:MAG: phosphoglycerol geranylgeranyltransferase [Methanophagales archaeon ANME-1-THS]
MNPRPAPWKNWKHITKLDPDKYISPDDLATIVSSGTDAIMISGTQNITDHKVSRLISLLKGYSIPKILEPVTPDVVSFADVHYIFVPMVLNAGNVDWIVGKHKDWIMNHTIQWESVIPEAYIVLNPDSAVAKLTSSRTNLGHDEIIAYARYAEKYLHLPLVYIEYSGMYGDPRIVKRLRESLTEATLFYGGGIESRQTAAEMSRYADVIVVGNVVYRSIEKFIETIP